MTPRRPLNVAQAPRGRRPLLVAAPTEWQLQGEAAKTITCFSSEIVITDPDGAVYRTMYAPGASCAARAGVAHEQGDGRYHEEEEEGIAVLGP